MHTECCAAALMHSTCFRFMASTEMKLESSSRYDVGVMYTWRLRNGTHSTYKYYTIPHITHNIYSQQIRTTLVRDEFESCWWVKHLMHKLYWYQVVTWNTQSSDCLTVWLPQLKRFRLELVLFQKLSGSMLHAHVHHLKQMLKAAILSEQKTWNKLNNII